MSSYFQEQAEESENEGSVASNSSDGPKSKKRKVEKKKKRRIESSDEEEDEEDDELKAREEMKGFVVDEDEDEGNEDGSDDEKKSEKSESDADDLLEDDLDLVNENIGMKVGGRVQISDDEDDREKIQRELFNGTGDDYEDDDFVERRPHRRDRSRSRSESSHESEEDDRFIVEDDDGHRRRRHRGTASNRAELREAQDIFGFEDEDILGMNEIFDQVDDYEDGEGDETRKEKTLLSVLEPEDLELHKSEDHKIIYADIPERFQTRPIPVQKAEEDELKLEAQWIMKRAFDRLNVISVQDGYQLEFIESGTSNEDTVKQEAPEKVQEALNFIRNSNLEVLFIAFYRKEHIYEILGVQDLWAIYEYDEKWLHLRDRQARLKELLRRMESFVNEVPESEGLVRRVKAEDYARIETAETNEEVNDCFEHFQLYYSNFLTRMVQHEIEKNQDPEHQAQAVPKTTAKNDKYWSCALNGPGDVVAKFGLTAEQVAENFEFPRHIAESNPQAPLEVAKDLVNQLFETSEVIIRGAKYVFAYQLSREPAVRRRVRQMYRNYAKLRVYPTRRGQVDIDESNPIFPRRYLVGKPVRELERAEFLEYHAAKEQGLLNVEVYVDPKGSIEGHNIAEDFMNTEDVFGETTETSHSAMEWKRLREEALEQCIMDILCPYFAKETYEVLLDESRKHVLKECRAKLEKALMVGRYRPTIEYANEEEERREPEQDSENKNFPPARIVAIAPTAEFSGESQAVALDENGVVLDHCPVTFHSKFRDQGVNWDVSLRAFIAMCRKYRPHVIAIAGTDLRSVNLKRDLERSLDEAVDDQRLEIRIPVEIVSAEVGRIFSNSKTGREEFPHHNPNTRLAISVGRCLRDPLLEYARLYNKEKDYLSIRLHPMQANVPERDLSWAFQREFVNRVNEVGVDINYCIEFPHTNGVMQFVCGFGPRKAEHVMQLLEHQSLILDARSKLVTLCSLGPTIFINSAGFIKIDIEKVRDTAEDYVEQLDGSRVHPETYEWARKMAMDALEYDETNDPANAIDDVIQQPDRLKELDLDAFAEELARQGFGNKQITLYDIRAELNHRYKDLRQPYQSLQGMDLFNILVPNPDLFLPGKLITGRVQRVQMKKSDPDRGPMDENDSRNQVGVRVILDEGVNGFIRRKDCSDDPDSIRDLNDVFKQQMPIICKILQFNENNFSCNLSCKGSDLKSGQPQLDKYFDTPRCEQDNRKLDMRKTMNTFKTRFVKRVISHQAFHNVTHADAERMLRTMNQGEAIIRPSSKSMNHLTVTWKVAEGVYQHVNIAESKKKHYFNLGKELKIDKESYEDLDEILARFVTPMAEYAREVLGHKYSLEGWIFEDHKEEIEANIKAQREQAPARIPYVFTVSREFPGKFVISYQLRKPLHEYFTVTPEGVRFRQRTFPTLESMINWFKQHYREMPRR
ncbi:unnamed protein product [Bursaphelenchus xylophilus]|uniref:Suppressor of Ty 6 homolog n=1 Tax=Bursaphelenchus xylophilus TaxID=6326 RepID=A0A1I7S9Y2_BURXY|nr:unnamed protein product [Bursaphelenchus xylophilus]CAG9126185.1 unnamed protein product [Bursaphelenchus xylophilus]